MFTRRVTPFSSGDVPAAPILRRVLFFCSAPVEWAGIGAFLPVILRRRDFPSAFASSITGVLMPGRSNFP